ncbi:hypothetical protein ACH4PU_35135 [Streptomyces sp. NPDC021100]|uniref:hypothetical protein n=1 Tax=Streptomyces sp. NPDC021100 TaxID=3365114 RepID=UPI0037AB20D7
MFRANLAEHADPQDRSLARQSQPDSARVFVGHNVSQRFGVLGPDRWKTSVREMFLLCSTTDARSTGSTRNGRDCWARFRAQVEEVVA